MANEIFSIVLPLACDPLRLDTLRQRLNPTGNDRHPIPGLPLAQLPMLHFASLVVFDGGEVDCDGECVRTAPLLVIECCIDGPRDAFLDRLITASRAALLEIGGYCVGFRPEEAADERAPYLKTFLSQAINRPQLHHSGNPRMRVEHVRSGQALRERLDEHLDDLVSTGRATDPPREIVERLRRALNVPGDSASSSWHFSTTCLEAVRGPAWYRDRSPKWLSRLWHWSKAFVLVLLPGVLLLVWWVILFFARPLTALLLLAAALVVAAAVWRWLQGRHGPAVIDRARLDALRKLEDVDRMNHMTSLVALKPGVLRRVSLRLVLGVFNLAYRTWFTDLTPGRIMGLHTIHFAQWTLIDLVDAGGHPTGRKGLMFLSNYDGSWDTYLDDFLAFLFNGVVAIWGNTVSFPSPIDGPRFKTWARNQMSPWEHWYKAYDLSVANIENNEAIRKGLLRSPRTDEEATGWLLRFGNRFADDHPLPAAGTLQASDIQGLVFSGYRHLTCASYVLLRVGDEANGASAAARTWLADLVPRITDGRDRSREELASETLAINVAFTASGLQACGLDSDALSQFSLPFIEGIAPAGHEHRSRALGDTGNNAPAEWAWGNENAPVDILLMAFGRGRHTLDADVKQVVDGFVRTGAGTVVRQQPAEYLTPSHGGDQARATEHFGFVDGLSQPIIEGTRQAARQPLERSQHLLKPGEVVLGYATNEGPPAPGVPVPAERDPGGLLPPLGSDGRPLRDFGRNGTYVVCRQLEQDVVRFREFTARAAGAPPPSQIEEAAGAGVAAHIVGRWRDGEPLASANSPGRGTNEFPFSSDPHGVGCPIGAHVRRANPRDSLLRDPRAALVAANRRRLLRRGRPYGPILSPGSNDKVPRGLMFLCLNGDIERQFEFVQQNWINGPGFGGLYDERDPLVGTQPKDGGLLTVQTSGVRERLAGIPPFVRVTGGGYFFMPGLRALRYLAVGGNGAAASRPAAIAAREIAWRPPLQTPSRVRRTLARLESLLPWLRLLWAVRFPLLLAASLVLLPLLVRVQPRFLASLFFVDRTGLFIVSLLASLAGFVVMITLRLVLMYGWRFGLGRGRWVTSTRWWQVFAFHALALPMIVTAIDETAKDVVAAGLGLGRWDIVWGLVPAAIGGCALALVLLMAVTAVQATRRGSRPDLFFPPNPFFARIAGPEWRGPRMLWISRLLSRLGGWLVDNVPPELGRGYIDYRTRRILPGHVFAASLAGLVAALYGAGAWGLAPAAGYDFAPPPVAFLLFALIFAVWLLSLAAFFLDRYRIPTLLPVLAWLAIIASVGRTDHFFAVGDPLSATPLSPADVVTRAERPGRIRPVIVVAAEGQGLASSAWTAEVLTRLSESLGQKFTDSLRLVSASSGASLGTLYFIHEYQQAGFPATEAIREQVRKRARTPSSSAGAWGLVYPDLVRTFAPLVVPVLVDRGWAMEQVWRRPFGRAEPTLGGWRRGVLAGWRPATAFGVTVVESGSRALLATYDPPGNLVNVTDGRDLSVVTAARLSSGFPFVSPSPRAYLEDRSLAYHVADGGYWDNFGVVAAIEWLRAAKSALGNRPVLLIRILSSSPAQRAQPQDNAWTLDVIGPLKTLYQVRYDAQPARNDLELNLLAEALPSSSGPQLVQATFRLDDDRVPLTWNLGRADPARVARAWARGQNQQELDKVRAFLAGQ